MLKQTSKPGNNLARKAWNFFGGGTVGVLLASVLGIILLNPNLKFGLGLIHLSYDLPYAIRPYIQPQEAAIVYLDEDSHKILNQPYDAPWNRSLHAQLINRMTAEGAKAVVFDIVFSDPGSNPQTDQELANAIRANGKVVLAADYVPTGYGRAGVDAYQIVPPYDPFLDAAAAIGSDEMNPDDDLVMRKQILMLPDDQIATMSWAAAKVGGAAVTKDDKNRLVSRWLNYYGPATTIPNVSFYQAILTNSPDYVPTGYFSNKVVFVGAHLFTKFSGERKDEYPTPYSRWDKEHPFMPGVEIQATVFLNLLRGDWLSRLPDNTERIILLICGVVFGFGLVRFRPLTATGMSILLALLVSISAYLSFVHLRIWFPWLLLEVQIFVALAWSVVYNSIRLYVQNKLFEASLEMYLSPKLVKKFAANKDLLKPGAKKETLTILFSDIASFTSISEGMDSDDLAKHMNSYFQTAVSGCIHHTDGTIVKYIGDAIFAFWNAPDPQDDHQLRACEAGLKFRDQPPQFMNGQQLITRIGLHTGVANVGNFGSTARVDYTALGENINLASRMEGLNKYLGTEVLITQETFDGIKGRLVARFLGLFRLKGFERSVGVYELVGTPDKAENFRALHETFAAALKLFSEKKLAGAETAFQKVLEINPKDGPSKFYLKHLAELKEHPLPEDWSGEVELKEK
jgi:adenylate cyclase